MRKELRTNILIFALWICLAIVIHFSLTCALVHPIAIELPVTTVEQSDASVEARIVKTPSRKQAAQNAAASPRETPKILDNAASHHVEHASQETEKLKDATAESKAEQTEAPPLETAEQARTHEPPQTEDTLTQANQYIPDALETEGTFTAEAEGTLIPIPPAATKSPAPRYPSKAKKEGRSGTTYLRVTVDESGKPLRVRVESSSGHRDLDERARETVEKRWRFANSQDTKKRGQPKVTFIIDIQFKLS